MNNFDFGIKILLSLTLLALFATPAMAEWDVNLDNNIITDGGNLYFSNGEKSVVFAEIKTEKGEPINESSITDSSSVIFSYNKSEGENQDMQYLDNGIWYAEYETDEEKHSLGASTELKIEAQGDRDTTDGVDSGGWKSVTTGVTVGNYTVNLTDSPKEKLIPGNKVEMSVNVSRRNDSVNINDSKVYAFLRNSTTSTVGDDDKIEFDYNETTNLYEKDVRIPSNHNTRYLLRVYGINKSDPIDNSYGSTSTFINTVPNLEGKVENLTSGLGCENSETSSHSAKCEPGGEVELNYNVTDGSPDSVNATLYKTNSTSGEKKTLVQKTLEKKESSIYSSNLKIPDVNLTGYQDVFNLEFELIKGDRILEDEREIKYSPLDVLHTGTRSTIQGQEYRIAIQAVRPYSLSAWEESRIGDLDAIVTDSDENQFADYNLSNFAFNSEDRLFENEILIPSDASIGGWDLDITATDIYGKSVEKKSGFSVASSEQTFNVSEKTFKKEEEGSEEFNLTVKNRKSDPINLETNLSDNLEGELDINETVTLNSGEQNITITTNMSSMESIKGNLTLEDPNTGYSQKVEISIEVASCQFSSGDLCSLDGKWVNVTADERGNFTEEIQLRNMAEDGNVTNITTNVTGNISEVMNIKDNYSVEGDYPVGMNFSVEEVGNYTGSVTFNGNNSTDEDNETALTFITSLETTFEEETEPGLDTPSKLDIGAVPEGQDISEEIKIRNTGAIEAFNVTSSSNEFTVSLNETNLNLSGGQEKIVVVTFEQLISEEGTVNITANSSAGNLLSTIKVNAETLENYSVRTVELETTVEELKPVSGGNLSNTLSEVSNSIDSIKDNWSKGNYLAAKNMFKEGKNRLEYVSNKKEEDTDPTPPEDNETQNGDNPGSEEGQNGENPDTGNSGGDQSNTEGKQKEENGEDGGGIPWIPVIGVLVILIIIGAVVIYESYIPEEGDPLYGVLGDK